MEKKRSPAADFNFVHQIRQQHFEEVEING